MGGSNGCLEVPGCAQYPAFPYIFAGQRGLAPSSKCNRFLKKEKKNVREMLFFGDALLQSTSNCVLNVLVTQEGKYALATFGCENKPDAAWGRNLGF